MNPFKLILATSASFTDYDLFRDKLDHLLQNQGEVELCTGFSKAGDALAAQYAAERSVSVKVFDPGFRGMYRALVYAEAALFFHDQVSAGVTKYIQEARDCRLRVKVVTFEAAKVPNSTPLKPPKSGELESLKSAGGILRREDSSKLSPPPPNELDSAIPAGRPRKRGEIVVAGEVLTVKPKAARKKKPQPAGDNTWKERYKAAHDLDFQEKYPSAFRDGHCTEPNYPKVRETNGLQSAIVNYLNYMGHRAKRINNMGRQVDGVDVTESGAKLTVKKWIPSAAGKGQADISSTIWLGKSAQWEVKAGNDKPSSYQLKEQTKERKAGGIYEFIYSIEQFFQVYDRLELSARNNYQQGDIFGG